MGNANDPAYPISPDGAFSASSTGLTKRELFAAMAMQGILSGPKDFDIDGIPKTTASGYAEVAVSLADALLAELAKEPGA